MSAGTRGDGITKDPKTGRWQFVVDVAPLGAPRRQVRRRGFATRREALVARDEVRGAVRTQTFVERSKKTVGAYLLDDWLPSKAGTLQPSTTASYARYIKIHVVPAIGAVPLQALDGITLSRFYSDLAATGRLDGKPGGLSPRTIRYIAAILHGAFRDAIRSNLLVRNPADGATLPSPAERREMCVWTGPEVERFLLLTQGNRYRSVWLFLATTGVRRGEALGLRWRDLDLDAARASIRQTITAVDHQVRVASRTKTGRGRAVDLDEATIGELRAHKARQAEEMLLLGLPPGPDTLVFCHPDGRPYHPERFSREFDRALERHDSLPRIRLHDLRHTWATLALSAGVPTKIVSERLGHRSTVITDNLYSHVTPTMQSAAAEKVAGLIFGTPHG